MSIAAAATSAAASASRAAVSAGLRFIDTHSHPNRCSHAPRYAEASDATLRAVALRGLVPAESQLDAYIAVFCEAESVVESSNAMHYSHYHSDRMFFTVGCHPHTASTYDAAYEEAIRQAAQHPRCVAIGEAGLDYFRDNSPRDVQLSVFERQIELAVELCKPLVIHSRDADDDMLNVMRRCLPSDHLIHLHCFTSQSADFAAALLREFPRLKIGFTGLITYKSARGVQDIVRNTIPLERLLSETDAPYMTPEPLRKVRADSGHVALVASRIAVLKGVPLAAAVRVLRDNAREIYGI